MSHPTRVLLLALLVLAPPAAASESSTLEDANARLYDAYVRAENAADFEGLASLIDASFQAELNGVALPGQGPQVEVEMVRPMRTLLPDYKAEIDQVITQGDFLVARWRIRGTHEGEGFGVSPTHRKVEIAGCTLFEIRAGKFVRGFNYVDSGGLLQQLGVMRQLSMAVIAAGGLLGAVIALAAGFVGRRLLEGREGRLARFILSGLVIAGGVVLFVLLASGLLGWLGRSAPV